MTTSEIEIQNNLTRLKAEIFDLIRQGEYIANLKNQKLQELQTLENNMRQANQANIKPVESIKPVEKTI